MPRRICIVTAGHLSTCPRMLKAADALFEAGYEVRVVSTRHVDWAWEADQKAYARRSWQWRVVDYSRRSGPANYWLSGVRWRLARQVAGMLGPRACPLAIAARAFGRVHPELVKAAAAEPADLYYGGTTGGLAAARAAAGRRASRYALDLEDFHTQEDSQPGNAGHALAERIERSILPGAAFLTAGSDAIAQAYAGKYGVSPIAINNTFPLPKVEPPAGERNDGLLRLYWFSQTVGPNRGLEDAVAAMGLAGIPGELHLRGQTIPAYLESLRALCQCRAPRLALVHHAPVEPDVMVETCHGYDVGLALEQAHVLNRALCLTNKAFVYMLGGLAVALTSTPGQRLLAEHLGEAAIVYAPGDVPLLARGLKRWADDRGQLFRAKRAAWEAAKRRWHWEHPEERGRLLELVARVVPL